MRIHLLLPLSAGFLAAIAIAGFPASASDQSIAASSATDTWNPNSVTIQVGENVTWSTDRVGFHNVCVLKPGASGDTCTAANQEFRNGAVSQSWSGYTNSHTFTAPGTYQFFCEAHKSLGMTGTITVQGDGSGTGTTPPTESQPTDTTTAPAPTPAAPDTTAPHFTSQPKRRAGGKSLVLEFGASEPGQMQVTVSRRAQGAHRFTRVGQAQLKVKKGHNSEAVPRRAGGSLRPGSYRVLLQLRDAAGNSSGRKQLSFVQR